MFSSVCALPSPVSAEGCCPSLFGWFTGVGCRLHSERRKATRAPQGFAPAGLSDESPAGGAKRKDQKGPNQVDGSVPTRYLHVIFTLPHRLAPLVLQNKKVLYGLLFRTSAETLLEVARNPRHLGAEIGFFSVLHTWSQKLNIHPHVHCVVPAGGLSLDHTRWVRSRDNYFLPKGVLRKIFRGKFVDALEQAFQNGQLRFEGDLKLLAQPKIFAAWLRPLFRQP
jgi:Putative transposase